MFPKCKKNPEKSSEFLPLKFDAFDIRRFGLCPKTPASNFQNVPSVGWSIYSMSPNFRNVPTTL